MLLIEAKNIKKQYGSRLLFNIEDLKFYAGDRIGIIGDNGSGKTTLVKILIGEDKDVVGEVKRYGSFGYVPQLDLELSGTLSGGEYTKEKINKAFEHNPDIIIADEPTCNLDINGVKYLENKFNRFLGSIILISHDRELLTKVCNKILEIDRSKIKIYKGNYKSYLEQKEKEKLKETLEYDKYIKEKNRLKSSMVVTSQRAGTIKKAPARMGISEARLHKRKAGERRAKVEANKKAIQTRLEQLEIKEKPYEVKKVKIKVPSHLQLNARIVIEGRETNKKYGKKVIFDNTDFTIENNKRTLLYGNNGSGKTTLLNMIVNKDESIVLAKKIKIGYFKQNLDNLNENQTILENVMSSTTRNEKDVRTILGSFLFRREDVFKKIHQLSGGERVKASFAKVFLSDINFLILDEPINYLDIHTRESLENALLNYEGAVLFVSHDRTFASRIAHQVIYIEKQKLKTFYGNYDAFIIKKSKSKKNRTFENASKKDNKTLLMLLENRMNAIIHKISFPEKGDDKQELEREYQTILKEIKVLKG